MIYGYFYTLPNWTVTDLTNNTIKICIFVPKKRLVNIFLDLNFLRCTMYLQLQNHPYDINESTAALFWLLISPALNEYSQDGCFPHLRTVWWCLDKERKTGMDIYLNWTRIKHVGAVLCCLCVALLHTFRYLPGYQLWSFVLCTGRRSFGDFSAILTCHSLKSGCPVFQRHQISVS